MWLICRNTFVPQSAIATTNRKCREWAGVFNNSDMMASAVLDRLLWCAFVCFSVSSCPKFYQNTFLVGV